MSVTVVSQSQQPYRQVITAGNHTFYADVPQAKGGQDTAPSPHELLLGALGACTSMTLKMYADRKGWQLDEISVTLDESKTQAAPGSPSMPSITKKIQVKGQLSQQQLDDLKRIAEKCPVNKLITGAKEMKSTLDLIA